nr:MFS transporter [Pseudonocardia sp. DSM 110487]
MEAQNDARPTPTPPAGVRRRPRGRRERRAGRPPSSRSRTRSPRRWWARSRPAGRSARWRPRHCCFSVGNALTALAPIYATVLLTRVVTAVGASLYTASATSAAATLAGPAPRGRAIAIVMLGITSSLVLGTPLSTVLGALLDWRATLWLVTALGVLAAVVIAVRLPLLRRDATAGGSRFAPLADGRVRELLACGRGTRRRWVGWSVDRPARRRVRARGRICSPVWWAALLDRQTSDVYGGPRIGRKDCA